MQNLHNSVSFDPQSIMAVSIAAIQQRELRLDRGFREETHRALVDLQLQPLRKTIMLQPALRLLAQRFDFCPRLSLRPRVAGGQPRLDSPALIEPALPLPVAGR